MPSLLETMARALPRPVKAALKRAMAGLRNRPFTPYLKKKEVEGLAFDFWIGDRDGRDWYDLNCTDPHWPEMRFLKDHLLEEGDVVLECGGHHGCTAIVMAHWVGVGGSVHTFEASPANCDIIEKNIRLNSLQNVTLERKAVGNQQGTITITKDSNSAVTSAGAGEEVGITRVDEYRQLNPTVLKIDVEGFEIEVLEGAGEILATRPKLAIEVHTDLLENYGATVDDLFRFIDPAVYRLWVQWSEDRPPEAYDRKQPITSRIHLFAIPHDAST